MKKVQVTKEEKRCLDSFINDGSTYTKQQILENYLEKHEEWENDYKPLRLLGIEKFVKCLFYGYEQKFDDKMTFKIKNNKTESELCLCYNTSKKAIFKSTINPIYIGLTDNKKSLCISLSIDQTEELIDNLRNLVYQIYEARSED